MIVFVKYVFKTVKIPAFPRLFKVNYVVVTSWKQTIWHVLTNIGAKSNKGKVLKASKFLLQKYIQHAYNFRVESYGARYLFENRLFCYNRRKTEAYAWFQLWSQLSVQRGMPCSREIYLLLGCDIVRSARYWQKQITPKRLTSPYVLTTMLGFFSRRSRPIRRTENYFAQIWNNRIQG